MGGTDSQHGEGQLPGGGLKEARARCYVIKCGKSEWTVLACCDRKPEKAREGEGGLFSHQGCL